MDEERRDVLARIDEKVVGRYNDIQRRSHEDVAGAEIRLTNKMSAVEVHLNERMVDLESRLTNKMGELESHLNDKMGALETRLTGGMSELRKEMADVRVELGRKIGDAKHTTLVWLVSCMVVQAGFMTLIAWASKHIF